MSEVVEIHIFSTLRLLISTYILLFWIPRKIFPQEYIGDSLDRVMFNIVHMVAVITLIFPIFIYLRVFGLPFVVMSAFGVRLLFIKYWYKRSILVYLANNFYHPLIRGGLVVLERGRENVTVVGQWGLSHWQRFRAAFRPLPLIALALVGIVVLYALFIRLQGTYSTMVASQSDMYQYFYWNKILRLNHLFDKGAGAPYPWGGPVLVHVTNILSNLDSIVLCNIFAVLMHSMTFFSMFYCCQKFFDPGGKGTAAAVLAILVVGVIVPSPWAEAFFGKVFVTTNPDILHLPFISIYSGVSKITDPVYSGHPFLLFFRSTNALPYEMSSSFFVVNLYFLMKLFVEKCRLYLLLYVETLGIIMAIHGAVTIPLFLPSLLIAGYGALTGGMNWKFIREGLIALGAVLLLGNLWILQFFIYGIPQDIGAAAPFLDRIFHTQRMTRDFMMQAVNTVQLVTPTVWLLVLFIASSGLLAGSFFFRDKGKRYSLACVAMIALGTLVLYGETNWGLPRLVDHTRLQGPLAFSYALTAAVVYRLLMEEFILKRIFRKQTFAASFTVMAAVFLIVAVATPKWTDTKLYWTKIESMELPEAPYVAFKIRTLFPPFSYTVISFVEGFSQVYGSGYHMNSHTFVSSYNPLDPELKIPTEYIFIFVENKPVTFRGGGQYWYQWRSEIMLKLKDWVALYGTSHDNMKLWFSNSNLHVYIIDNRKAGDPMSRTIEKLEEKGR